MATASGLALLRPAVRIAGMKQGPLRAGAGLAEDEVVVVRGGELDVEVLRAAAVRYHDIYGTYGISVFAARDITVDELAQQPLLIRFETLALVAVGVLRAAGFGWTRPAGTETTSRSPSTTSTAASSGSAAAITVSGGTRT